MTPPAYGLTKNLETVFPFRVINGHIIYKNLILSVYQERLQKLVCEFYCSLIIRENSITFIAVSQVQPCDTKRFLSWSVLSKSVMLVLH